MRCFVNCCGSIFFIFCFCLFVFDNIFILACVYFGGRFLDPDPPHLLSELSKSMGKKYYKLNMAITTLVSIISIS